MPLPPLTAQTLALLAAIVPEDGKDTTAHTDSLYGLVEPMQSTIEHVMAKLNDVDKLRRAADRTEEQEVAYMFFERIKQTGEAAQRQCRDALAQLDALTDTLFQMDHYALDMRRSLEEHVARAKTP